MPRPVFATIDEYIAAQPPEVQPVLERVRGLIRKLLPRAEETISYGVPTYKQHGTYVAYFAGFKQHYSLFPVTDPVVAAFGGDLTAYKASKGTLRFSYGEPVPVKIIQGVVKALAENAAARVEAQRARKTAARKTVARKTVGRKKKVAKKKR